MSAILPHQHQSPDFARLTIWVIYAFPKDYPNGYVLRPQYVCADNTIRADRMAWYAPTADKLRDALAPLHLHCLPRQPGDDDAILETWL